MGFLINLIYPYKEAFVKAKGASHIGHYGSAGALIGKFIFADLMIVPLIIRVFDAPEKQKTKQATSNKNVTLLDIVTFPSVVLGAVIGLTLGALTYPVHMLMSKHGQKELTSKIPTVDDSLLDKISDELRDRDFERQAHERFDPLMRSPADVTMLLLNTYNKAIADGQGREEINAVKQKLLQQYPEREPAKSSPPTHKYRV